MDEKAFDLAQVLETYQVRVEKYPLSASLKNQILSQREIIDQYKNRSLEEICGEEDLAYYFLAHLEEAMGRMSKLGLAEADLYASLSDLFYRLERNYQRKGQLALTKEEGPWLQKIINGQLVKLGSFQFECLRLNLQKAYPQVTWIRPLENIEKSWLALHIMDGEDISQASLKKSLSQAREIFPREEIYCYSWLLYSPMMDLVGKNSRIYDFYSAFDIYGLEANREKAVSRLFGPEKLGKETTLTKKARAKPDKLGLGLGLLKKNILASKEEL